MVRRCQLFTNDPTPYRETCDDGDLENDDDCVITLTTSGDLLCAVAFCGDGHENLRGQLPSLAEDCDDVDLAQGSDNPNDGCYG